jgi:cytochrome c peroxidase
MTRRFVLAAIAGAALVLGCSGGGESEDAKAAESAVVVNDAAIAAFQALPEEVKSDKYPMSPELVALGRMLYYDDRLSKGEETSCNSCHGLSTFGVDNQRVSLGHDGQEGTRNSPTVYNAAGQIAQFWDGRAADVEEQAKGPVLNPVEMAMPDAEFVESMLRSIPGYVEAFSKAFPGQEQPVTFDNMAIAIGAFERKLVTPSRWDAFLAGDKNALTDAEKRGFNTFVDAGCNACHSGSHVGGALYNKLGLVKPWPDNTDLGRFEVTKSEDDRYFFKVPGLRNIQKTYPYLHDGSIDDLGKTVSMMSEYQLGKTLTDDEVGSIVAFLGALTGEIPAELVAKPQLPAPPSDAD